VATENQLIKSISR